MLTATKYSFLLIVTTWVLICNCGCATSNNRPVVTYTPHSKKQQQLVKPSVSLITYIIEFREAYNAWPTSKKEFIEKHTKYKDAFADFPYLNNEFKIIDNDNMTFYFTGHTKDVEKYSKTQKIDLNSYGGEVRFYKENGKFVWKTKMY